MLLRDGIITATRLTLWDAKAPAILLGTYPRRRAASFTFSRVVALTSPLLRKTRLTVMSLTPEASETSRNVRGLFDRVCTGTILWDILTKG